MPTTTAAAPSRRRFHTAHRRRDNDTLNYLDKTFDRLQDRVVEQSEALYTVLALLPAGHTVPKCQGECSYCRIRHIITEAVSR